MFGKQHILVDNSAAQEAKWAMENALWTMRESLQDALDRISSPRSTSETRTKALETVEQYLATSCASSADKEDMDSFLALQYTFECNVPLRLLPWIAKTTSQLEGLVKGSMDDTQDSEACALASQIALALSLMQGVSLIHTTSKEFLGRVYALEVLVDLLLASRHLPATLTDASPNLCRKQCSTSLPLTSVVLDTLLCILVDSSPSLRSFEDVSGPQAVVKILKRAGTPREVRMKCLEFLYFYLLDETPSTPDPQPTISSKLVSPLTAPPTPIRPSKPYLSATPLRPASTYGSSTFLFSDSTSSSGRSSRSTSGSSTQSFSSTSSNASSSTAASSISSSPEKVSSVKTSLLSQSPDKTAARVFVPQQPQTPNSPPLAPSRQNFPQPLQPRSLMMLKKELDFVPLSPTKPQVSGLGISPRHNPKSKSMSIIGSGERRPQSRLISSNSVPDIDTGHQREEEESKRSRKYDKEEGRRKSTEQKKELLGTMLGNVDALVEGVRKAGIWGLG